MNNQKQVSGTEKLKISLIPHGQPRCQWITLSLNVDTLETSKSTLRICKQHIEGCMGV